MQRWRRLELRVIQARRKAQNELLSLLVRRRRVALQQRQRVAKPAGDLRYRW